MPRYLDEWAESQLREAGRVPIMDTEARIPICKLVIEAFMTNPVQPTGYAVMNGKKIIALIPAAEVERAFQQFNDMQREWEQRKL